MENTEARNVANKRPRAGANQRASVGQARTAPIEQEDEITDGAPAHQLAHRDEAPKHTRTFKTTAERTHFTFSIELPLEWQGALKWASIKAQRRGEFTIGGRENDAQALLRHRVRQMCEEIISEDEE